MKKTALFMFILLLMLTGKAFPVTTHRLDNGMCVILDDYDATGLAGISIMFQKGTLYENEEERGTFRLLTEALLRGSRERTKNEIARDIALLGDEVSLTVTREYWEFKAKVPPERLEFTLALAREVLFYPMLSEGEVERARNIRIQSIRSGQDAPVHRLFELFSFVFYPAVYASPKKREKNIMEIPVGSLRNIHTRYFRTDTAILAVTGNIHEEAALSTIQGLFGGISPGEPVQTPFTETPFADTPAAEEPSAPDLPDRLEKRGGLSQSGIIIGTRLEGFDRRNEHVLRVLNAVLNNSVGGRLFEKVRKESGLVYSVRPYYILHTKPYAWFVYSTTRKRNISRVTNRILEVLEELRTNPPSEQELELAKRYVHTRTALSHQNPAFRASYLAERYIRGYEPDGYEEQVRRIMEVTVSDLIDIIGLFPDEWTVLILR